MGVETIPQPVEEKVAPIEKADLLVGLLAEFDAEGVTMLCQDLRTLPGMPRVVVLQTTPVAAQPAQNGDTVVLTGWPPTGSGPAGQAPTLPAACETLFAETERLGARACCLISSKMESAAPRWICDLLLPMLEPDCDLVMPYFATNKLQGLLNSSILYPLTRALFGKRIHNPLGPDVAVSQRLAASILNTNRNARAGINRAHPLASLVPVAVCGNLHVSQVFVGARVYPPTNWVNTSSLLVQVLSPIFLEIERTAACWQRVRGSSAVAEHGEQLPPSTESVTLDLNRMVETFQLGVRDLQEIWSLVLPPATLLELRKLSRLAPEKISMPDDLWARTVYDFALAHRLRTVNPDHLLGSMTPLYLAWVSSYAREMETAEPAAAERRIERLALAFEAAKPYFVSRWRWPDRFNP